MHPLRLILAAVLIFVAYAALPAQAQYPRTVLIEEFTSVTCKPCTTATAVINQILASPSAPRIAVIRNQVKNPNPINPYSTPESEARSDFYDPNMGLPFASIDGNTSTRPNDQSQFVPRVQEQLTVESPLQITVQQSVEGNQITGSVNLHAGPDGLAPGDYRLYIVGVERMISDPTITSIPGNNGETVLYDVMRKMANGTDGVSFTIDPDQSSTVPFSYAVESAWHSDQMFTVVFVQRTDNNEVVQAAFSSRPQAGVAADAAATSLSLAVAPQPARERATVTFSLDAPARATLSLRDMAGTTVRTLSTEVLPAGRRSLELDLAGLPAGVYTCTVGAGERRGVQQVVVVR